MKGKGKKRINLITMEMVMKTEVVKKEVLLMLYIFLKNISQLLKNVRRTYSRVVYVRK